MLNPWSGLGTDDFAAALAALYPRGPAWPRDPDSTQARYRAALADIQAAFHADLSNLADVELNPFQTDELLPDWEDEFGLPDPCVPQPQSTDQRHAALVSRIADPGGLNAQRYVELAASIGYAITITEFTPFVAGVGACGGPTYDLDWRFVWQVNGATSPISSVMRADSACNDSLQTWGDSALECLINSRNRPSRIVLFNYSG